MHVLTLAAYTGATLALAAAEDAEVCINKRLGKSFVCKEDQFCCGERCCPRTLLIFFWAMAGIVLLIVVGLACLCNSRRSVSSERISLIRTEQGNAETYAAMAPSDA